MIKIICTGVFYSVLGEKKELRNFREEVLAESLDIYHDTFVRYVGTDDNGNKKFTETRQLNIRGRMKRELMPMVLAKKYPDFAGIRKLTIEEITSDKLGELTELPVQLLAIGHLRELIKQRSIPIDPDAYLNIDDLRTDIIEYLQDPQMYTATAAMRTRKRQAERTFLITNRLVPVADDTSIPKAAGKAPRSPLS